MGKRYYGIHIGHDATIVIYNEYGKLEYFNQAERICRQKTAWPGLAMSNFGNFPIPTNEDVIAISSMSPSKFKLWKQGHNYDSEVERFFQKGSSEYPEYCLGESFPLPKYNLHHHLCHIVAAWAYRENEKEKFCMAYDGAGHDAQGEITCYLGGYISHKGFERKNITSIPSSNILHHLMGPNTPGKVMGLSGYLDPKESLNNFDFVKLIENTCGKSNDFNGSCPYFPSPHSDEDLMTIAKFYKFWINHIWNALEENIKKYRKQDQGVLIGGGTSLALELNTRIWNACHDVTFCPATNDSGLALGAANYCYFLETGKWPEAISGSSHQYLPEPNPIKGTQDPTKIARLIANGKIIALIRGQAEIGPRSLGYRSILARADKEFNLKKVSHDIKRREYFRPLAPMVTSDAFEKYFIGPKGKYMQYMVHCNNFCQENLPAIVHKDLTSRPQVVYSHEDPWLYTLLNEYGKITGHPVLINTSLNGKDKPICNTLNDVENDMKGKNIEIISV